MASGISAAFGVSQRAAGHLFGPAGRLFRPGGDAIAAQRSPRNWFRSESGGSVVEFALTAPILLTIVFGLMEVCMASYCREMISEVAREGTRYAIVHGATCTTPNNASCTVSAATINSYVTNVWPRMGGGTMNVNTTFPDGNQNPGSRVQVTVTYNFPLSIPWIPASTLTMSTASVMYIVQ
jgi:Flp pilus assembly protein TadG